MPPWIRPSYSNLGFALLGRILEDIEGVDVVFEEFVQTNILNPLSMGSTGFNYTEEVLERLAVGYNPDGSIAPIVELGWEAPAGQMYTSADDLAQLMRLFLMSEGDANPTPVLDAPFLQEMMNPTFLQSDGETIWGMPFETVFMHNYLVRSKGGNINGYSTYFSLIPELQLGLNIFWNGEVDDELGFLAYDILIPAFVDTLSQMQPTPPLPPDPENYIGEYIIAGSITAQIEVLEGYLLLFVDDEGVIELALSYFSQGIFQIWLPPNTETCSGMDFSGTQGEYVFFQMDESGIAQNFTIPGLIYGFTGVRETK